VNDLNKQETGEAPQGLFFKTVSASSLHASHHRLQTAEIRPTINSNLASFKKITDL